MTRARTSSTGRMPVTGARSARACSWTWSGGGWRWRRRRGSRRCSARGERRRSRSGDGLLLVVGADDVARGFEPPPDATVIAQYEPLTATEQQRLDGLQQQIRGSLGSTEEPDWTLADSAFGRQVLRDQGAPARPRRRAQRAPRSRLGLHRLPPAPPLTGRRGPGRPDRSGGPQVGTGALRSTDDPVHLDEQRGIPEPLALELVGGRRLRRARWPTWPGGTRPARTAAVAHGPPPAPSRHPRRPSHRARPAPPPGRRWPTRPAGRPWRAWPGASSRRGERDRRDRAR